MKALAYFPALANEFTWLAPHMIDFINCSGQLMNAAFDLWGYCWCEPALMLSVAVLTCPARVAATVATHSITAISVATVTALSTFQPEGTVLTTTKTTAGAPLKFNTWQLLQVAWWHRRIKTHRAFGALSQWEETYRAGLITVLTPPPRRTSTGAIDRVTHSAIVT